MIEHSHNTYPKINVVWGLVCLAVEQVGDSKPVTGTLALPTHHFS